MEKSLTENSDSFDYILKTRTTVHNFNPEPVPKNVIDAALEAFVTAPNHFLTKPWRIYVLGERTIEKIVDLNTDQIRSEKGEKLAMLKKERWSNVPCWILINCVYSDDQFRFQEDYASCACGIQNMMLSLWAKGYGSKWTTGPITRHSKFSEIVDFDPKSEVVVGLLWSGLPKDLPKGKKRDPQTNVNWLL